MIRKVKRYGWRPDLPHNHKKFSAAHLSSIDLPPVADLRHKCPPVYDQGDLGSCTGNGVAACVQYLQPSFMPSRLFIYYNERVIEGDPEEDGGAQIHDGIQTLVDNGCCSEAEWPYDVNQFAAKPTDQCYQDALNDLITDYYSIDNNEGIKQCIHSGFPVVFGMSVFESFENPEVAQTGMVPMPAASERTIGGHCMVIVGYDDSKSCFIVRNSWGEAWGLAGYCYIPYAYIEQYASDFWTIRKDTGE